jgi:hypothetical protein
MIVPKTVPAVTSTEIVNARGKFVRLQASVNPSRLNGAGSEKALPSTACSVVLKAIETVT